MINDPVSNLRTQAGRRFGLSPIKRLRWIILLIGTALLAISGVVVVLYTSNNSPSIQGSDFEMTQLPIDSISVSKNPLGNAKSLQVNGQLEVSSSIILSPGVQPTNPVIGQFYFDQTSNRLSYYDGRQFVSVGNGGTTNITNITNNIAGDTTVTNVLTGGQSAVSLQSTSPGVQQTGNFNLSGTGQVGTLKTSAITSDDTLLVTSDQTAFKGSSNSSSAFQVQNASGQNLLSVDTAAGNVTLQGRSTGDISVATEAGGSVTGDISIKTGDSSTTASGDIAIDTGVGIVDGEIVGNKTFESGLDNLVSWFGSTVAQTTEQAHGGTHSLKMTATDAFWGVQENINQPITPVVPGHQYHFSMWVRAGSTGRSITSRAVWVGGGGTSLNLQTVTDNSSGWTEITGLGVAPGGATGVYPTFQGTGVVGEVHYFDDIVITDLSSSSAASSITIGSTNAKRITLGNLNQIGSTSIYGGSGISLQSGAGNLTLSGGAVSVTGNAASSFTTNAGALTITSAASATWSVAPASTGVGGNLTLRAGNGGTDNDNNGGDLVLQGGNANGAGIDGGVVIRPQSDSSDIFQIQNSAGTTLFLADSSDMKLTVTGTNTTYARLVLADAHFGSTQTTPPTISTPTNCGTSPTATIGASSTDTAGTFTITTGTGGTSSTCDITFTFNKAYATAPKSIIIVGKTDAASALRQIYVSGTTTTTFTASFANSTGGTNSTAYNFSYWIVE